MKLEVLFYFGGLSLWYFPSNRDSMEIVYMKLIIYSSQVKVFVSRQDSRQQMRHINFFYLYIQAWNSFVGFKSSANITECGY